MIRTYERPILVLALPLVVSIANTGCSRTPILKGVKTSKTLVESSITTTTAGTVMAEKQANLAFGTTGRIRVVHVQAGQRVRSGQILAELENADLKIMAEDAARELQRAEQLYADGLISQAALDDAKKAVEVARSNHEKTIIRAPFDGLVTERNLELGELNQAATNAKNPPLQIVDLRPRFIRGDIDEIDLGKVKVGMPARVRVQAVRPEPFAAKVSRVVPFVSTAKEQERTSKIEMRFEDSQVNERIPVGASADIEIIVSAREGAVSVPSRVLLGHGEARYVYRYTDGRVGKVSVKTGMGNYVSTEILSGLSLGDVVVFPPDDIELKDGLRVQVNVVSWP